MGEDSMIETIAILAACIVFLAKQGHEIYKARNGSGKDSLPGCQDCYRLVRDLHSWSRPVTDQHSGQLHFPWYMGYRELREDLVLHRRATQDLQKSVDRLRESIEGHMPQNPS